MAWSGNTSGFGLGPGLAGWFFIFIVGGFGIGEPAISIMFIMLLLVYGAFFLALEYSWNEDIKEINQKIQKYNLESDFYVSLGNYRHSIEKGLLKVMSKMGISTLTSYHGSMLLHAIGLGRKLSKELYS